MIRYRLKCKKGHQFDAWFASSAAYEKQAKGKQLCCAKCGSAQVSKALMTPKVAKGSVAKLGAAKEMATVAGSFPSLKRIASPRTASSWPPCASR